MSICLDCNASTRPLPEVLELMSTVAERYWANPAAVGHAPGKAARARLDEARKQLAEALGVRARELFFGPSASWTNNLATAGIVHGSGGGHALVEASAHASILAPLRRLEAEGGCTVELLEIGTDGRIDPQQLADALRPDTRLVAILAANNETGVIQPLAELAAIAKNHRAHFHLDAVQTLGRIPVDLSGWDSATWSAHKAHGPKGVGLMWLDRDARRPRPVHVGGAQERGLVAGTQNLPGAAGIALAAELVTADRESSMPKIAAMRDRLEKGLLDFGEVRINGDPAHRLANTTNLAFEGVDGSALVASLADIGVASGSACASRRPEPSHVLRAMAIPDELARASLRLSLDRFTRESDIDLALGRFAEELPRLRNRRSCG